MLDERKVKLMTKMAFYEQKTGEKDMKVSAYYRKDYVSLHTLCSLIWASVGYACLVFLIVLTGLDTWFDKLGFGPAAAVGAALVFLYPVLLIIYGLQSRRLYDKRHREARTRVKRYNHDLIRLLKMYEKENR